MLFSRVKSEFSKLKSERGAASVLVIFMMIILVTFGALSLTAALANLRLGSKVLSWMDGYYSLDSRAEILCAEMDSRLLLAEQAAQSALTGEVLNEEEFNRRFTAAYFSEASAQLGQWTGSEPAATLEVTGDNDDLKVIFNLSDEPPGTEPALSSQEKIKYLTVVLQLNQPSFSLKQTASGPLYYRQDSFLKRYTIVQWQEWQEETEYHEQEFWDGTIPF